jgi:hypothetical protein
VRISFGSQNPPDAHVSVPSVDKLWRVRTSRGVHTIQKEGGRFYLIPPVHPDEPRAEWGGHEDEEAKLGTILAAGYDGDGAVVESPFSSGDFHSRIWRGEESPTPLEAGLRGEWISTVRATRMLYARLRDLFRCIEPARTQDATFGFEQRELLMLASTEVESAWKSTLVANGASPQCGKADRWTTVDYVRLLGPMRLAEWSVSLSSHPDYGPIAPFAGWDSAAATTSLPWYDAYNGVKHDREKKLPLATFGSAVNATAAAFVMTLAQFGDRHLADDHFHADEFKVDVAPKWDLVETYIRPMRSRFDGQARWLGHERWTAKPCAL